MSAFLTMTVPGCPVPKARPRKGANGNFYTPRTTARAEQDLGWQAKRIIRGRKTSAPVAVVAAFYVAERAKGDVDNLLKTLLDAFNGVVWVDDSQVVHADAWIVLDPASPRTEVTVTELPGTPCAIAAGGHR